MGMEKGKILYLDVRPWDPIHQRKLAGICRYAEQRGWKVKVVGSRASRPDRIEALIARCKPIGCIVECSIGNRDLAPRLFKDVPTVWLDVNPSLYGGRMPKIVSDNDATAREAFRELSSNRPDFYAVVEHNVHYHWSRSRVKGFKELVRRKGRTCLSFFSPEKDDRRWKRNLVKWIAGLPRKCAVFAVNDVVSGLVRNACREVGKKIPADLTLIGVDNEESICESSAQRLSSIQIDFERAGYRAAMLVDDLIAGRGEKIKTFGPLMTVRRESTRGFGRREPRMLAAIDLIRKESCSGLRASEVVKLFKGSRRLVDLRFRETFGHSILDEIQNVRFEKVFFLLSQTETELGAIAGLCGFKSEITLREQFRLRTGMSMSAWRKANVMQ